MGASNALAESPNAKVKARCGNRGGVPQLRQPQGARDAQVLANQARPPGPVRPGVHPPQLPKSLIYEANTRLFEAVTLASNESTDYLMPVDVSKSLIEQKRRRTKQRF